MNKERYPMSAADVRGYIAEQMCPFCQSGPWRKLPVHTYMAHGVNQAELRNLADLSSRDDVSSSEHVELMRKLTADDPRSEKALEAAHANNVLKNAPEARKKDALERLASSRNNQRSKLRWMESRGYLPKPEGALNSDDPRHGTQNAYRNLKCRCDLCKQANRETMRAYRASRQKDA